MQEMAVVRNLLFALGKETPKPDVMILTEEDGFNIVEVAFHSGDRMVLISLDATGWDIYTSMHQHLWNGTLSEWPPQDVIDKVKSYLFAMSRDV